MVLAPQLPPDLAHAIDLEVVIEDPADLGLQGSGALGSRRSLGLISTPGDMSVFCVTTVSIVCTIKAPVPVRAEDGLDPPYLHGR